MIQNNLYRRWTNAVVELPIILTKHYKPTAFIDKYGGICVTLFINTRELEKEVKRSVKRSDYDIFLLFLNGAISIISNKFKINNISPKDKEFNEIDLTKRLTALIEEYERENKVILKTELAKYLLGNETKTFGKFGDE